jgi:hypothetical protein
MMETLSNLVEATEGATRIIATAMAMRAQIVDQARMFSEVAAAADQNTELAHREMLRRAFRAELGAALRMPERAIETLLHESESLVHELPATLAASRTARSRTGMRRSWSDRRRRWSPRRFRSWRPNHSVSPRR